MKHLKKIINLLLRSTVLTVACVLVGLLFNASRSDGIPLIAPVEYEIYGPCPESEATAEAVDANVVRTKTTSFVYVDARPPEEYQISHIKGAINVPYPVLGDLEPEQLTKLKNAGASIVTYDGGGRDKLGEMMAKLLTEEGIQGVTHLNGGLVEWQKQGGEVVLKGVFTDGR